MYFDNMVLYYKPTCPFCHKVLAFMEQEDIAMPMRDTLEPGVKDDHPHRRQGPGAVPYRGRRADVRVRRHHPLPRRPHLGARRGLGGCNRRSAGRAGAQTGASCFMEDFLKDSVPLTPRQRYTVLTRKRASEDKESL